MTERIEVRLDEDDVRTLDEMRQRNGFATRASFIRSLVRGMRREHTRQGSVTADMSLGVILVQLAERMEYHRKKCGEHCPHAMEEYVFIADRNGLSFTAKKPEEGLSMAVRIPNSPQNGVR